MSTPPPPDAGNPPDAAATRAAPIPPSSASTYVGPYRLLQPIGEGGMGEVWLAEQQQPVRRQVALKVIKAGMDTRQVIARFEAERQALALMDHPGIATVFDGGATSQGRPYFAMEYVKGEPITTYCDRHRLTTGERVRLFALVCDAVQHAHQKGVIHRDLKPSNILVTIRDDGPVPKIIDFGVAKATAMSLTDRSLFTELGALIGTPAYMSPEQAEMTGLDIDTRTDVYALGVVLYELLTGALPFDRKMLRQAGLDEIRRIIREEEPPKPSTRLTQLGPASTDSAQNRHTEVSRLAGQLRGDLDWITMRALEKDRTRRYATANALATDLRRHLDDEPVSAGPPSAIYRTRKLVRRHRAAVAATVALVVALVGVAATLAVQARRIAAQRDIAARERDRAERVSAFLVSLFKAATPDRAKGDTVTARELLDRGQQRLREELKDQPQIRAALLHSIGEAYGALGREEAAEAAFTEALTVRRSATGRDRADLADTLNGLAGTFYTRGDLQRGEPLYREALQIRREVLGPAHLKIAQSLANMANFEFYRGRYADAESLYREAAAMATRVGAPEEAAVMRASLADTLDRQDRLAEGIAVLEESLRVLMGAFGAEHSRTQYVMNSLAVSLYFAERYPEAEKLQRQILTVRRKMLGNEHFDVALALYNLANSVGAEGRRDEADGLMRESIVMFRKVRPGADRNLAWALADHGHILKTQGQLEEAEREYREAIEMFERAPNAPPGEAGWALDGLGSLYYARHQLPAATETLRKALALRRAAPGPRVGLAETEEELARVLCERGRSDEAVQMAREAIDIRRTAPPQGQWRRASAEAVLGRCLVSAGDFSNAEATASGAYTELARRGAATEEAQYAARVLADLYQSWGKKDKAAEWRERVDTVRRARN
jgi:serine/threonine protein kinase